MHYSRRASKTPLWVIYNDTQWLCCCHLLSSHRSLLGSGLEPDSWHLLRIQQYQGCLHNVLFLWLGLDLQHIQGSWRYFFRSCGCSAACKRGSRPECPVAIRVELRLHPFRHGEFELRLSFRTGWLSLTAEAEGHHVPLGTVAVPPCHFHSVIHMADCSEAEGEIRGKEREMINWTPGRRPEIAEKIFFKL